MENELFKFIAQYIEITDKEKQVITELDLFKTFKKGDVLLKKGDLSNESYFVLKGCLRSYYIIDGEEKTTEFYTESEGVAPQSVLSKSPSDYYISCVEDCILSVSTSEMESEIFEKFPRFETMCRILSEELLAKNQTSLANFKNLTPEQRYLHLIEARPDLVQRVPQYQLASYLGIKAESLSRIRQRLTQK